MSAKEVTKQDYLEKINFLGHTLHKNIKKTHLLESARP